MVKLFKKDARGQKKSFKFNASLNLKGLSLEEYAHVLHAFQKSFSQLDQLLKESLIEQYITYSTFDRISQELKLVKLKKFNFLTVKWLKEISSNTVGTTPLRKKLMEDYMLLLNFHNWKSLLLTNSVSIIDLS